LHVNSSKSRSTLFGSSSSNKAFQDFPSFHDHCTYNGTLGLSQDFITKIFNFLQETQSDFHLRYMGGVYGEKIQADHHHNVPQRIKFNDGFFRGRKAKIHGMHGWMTEIMQVGSLLYTSTTSCSERGEQAEEMKERFDARGVKLRVAALDKCCNDASWLRDVFGAEIAIILDNAHLLCRYNDACGKKASASLLSLFMKQVSECLVGKPGERIRMRKGMEIYDEISALIANWQHNEATHEHKVVVDAVKAKHEALKCHYLHCLDLPDDVDWKVVNRYGRASLFRGSHQLESFWRHLRKACPEQMGSSFAERLILAFTTRWNFDREVMFDKRWAFLPISSQHLSLAHYIALQARDVPPVEKTGISASIFELPLSTKLSRDLNIFGLAPSFYKKFDEVRIPRSLQVTPEDAVFAKALLAYSMSHTNSAEPVAQALVARAAASTSSQILSATSPSMIASNIGSAPSSSSSSCSRRQDSPLKRQYRSDLDTGICSHYTGKGSHKKSRTSKTLGMRRSALKIPWL
jgi:hypothetical protein